ncbi:hypothetical protein TRVA0_021S02168 [Trichomonascus vanleenenianus]|uniref:uncharacterized protein n=1 Tax=Trichomonascus vanleenenianus TaxID=2268995 RepID=UPI003ECBA5B8
MSEIESKRRTGPGDLKNSQGAKLEERKRSDNSMAASTPKRRKNDPNEDAPKNTWIFPRNFLDRTPSVLAGMSTNEELVARAKAVNFISKMAEGLRLNHITRYTATLFMHRFYARESLTKHHQYNTAGVVTFLATKVEETHRKLRDVTKWCCRVARKDNTLDADEQSLEFQKWRTVLINNEILLLKVLCFDYSIDSPVDVLHSLVKRWDLSSSCIKTCQYSWRFLVDSAYTPLCLFYDLKTIAAAALYWGQYRSMDRLPRDAKSDQRWFEAIGIEEQELMDACNCMADLMARIVELRAIDPPRHFEKIPRLLYGEMAKDYDIMEEEEEDRGDSDRLPEDYDDDDDGAKTPTAASADFFD